MADMAIDRELQRHVETWHGFARLVRWAVAGIVLVLIILAASLL